MRRPTALVIGAGIMGLSCALALSRRFAVTVIDPGGDNASTVAAGMLVPAAETVLDDQAPPYPLLAAALDAWPAFADVIGLSEGLHRCGALITGIEAERAAAWLNALGATVQVVSASEAGRRQSHASFDGPAVWAPDDARVDVAAAMTGLRKALDDHGVTARQGRVLAVEPDAAALEGGGRLSADRIVIAAGHASGRLAALPPLTPIRGQLIRFHAGADPAGGAIVRTPTAYLVPSGEGPIFGATMEPGVADALIDDAVCAGLADAARALAPTLRSTPWRGAAGIRAATDDGLPLVGRLDDRVLVASGLRRNGWLLAPLAAHIVAELAGDADGGPFAQLTDPSRSSPSWSPT